MTNADNTIVMAIGSDRVADSRPKTSAAPMMPVRASASVAHQYSLREARPENRA